MIEGFSEYANYSVQSLLNDLKIRITSLSSDEKMNPEPPVALGYQLVSSLWISEDFHDDDYFSDVMFCEIITQISIDFRSHQSSN